MSRFHVPGHKGCRHGELTSFVTTPNPGSGEIAFYNVPTTAWGYVQVFCAMPKNSVIR
jgi:hypothetical protein